MRVFYYAPDDQTPSWGIGMLYMHVRLLRANGFEAFVLHEKPGFRPGWLDRDAPRTYRGEATFQTRPDDVLIIPEIFAARQDVCSFPGRRIVFVQASSFISAGLLNARDYTQLGYETAMVTMPHVQAIVEKHYGTAAFVVPPCIAPYFFLNRAQMNRPRKRQVVLISKAWCRDISIARQMLRDITQDLDWRLIHAENQTHRDIARLLRQSAFHVSVNCHESFNATVPEAMAAGCIPICYEAFGGRDFLKHAVNAYVFPTHDAYALLDCARQLMASYDSIQKELRAVRRGGMATARRYTEADTERALLRLFAALRLRRARK